MRDGEQSPGVAFSLDDKIAIALALDELGIDMIGAGFPAVSAREAEAVREIARLGLEARVGVTCRALAAELDLVAELGIGEAHVFLPTSDIHLAHKMGGLSRADALTRIDRTLAHGKRLGLRLAFIAEDASRTEFTFLQECFACAEHAGAETVLYADTLGVLTPQRCQAEISALAAMLRPQTHLGIHCHDDFGLATANTLAAALAGADYITATINGIGERAGNAATEEVALALIDLYGVTLGIRTERIMQVSDEVARRSGMVRAANKAIVGHNMFRHESGIHTAAMIRALETYEFIRPERVGAARSFVIGKHSGRAHLQTLLREHGIAADEKMLAALLAEIARRFAERGSAVAHAAADGDAHAAIAGLAAAEILRHARAQCAPEAAR